MAHYTTTLFYSAAALLLMVMLLPSITARSLPPPMGMPGCDTRCGNMSVPYPFGMGPSHCYHSPGFNLTCDRSSKPPRLLLGDGTIHVARDIGYPNYPYLEVFHTGDVKTDSAGLGTFGGSGLGDGGPYALSTEGNQLILVGCNVGATLRNGKLTMSSCSSFCYDGITPDIQPSLDSTMVCSGMGCCQAPIVVNREVATGGKLVPITSYEVEIEPFGWNRSEAQQRPPRVFLAASYWIAASVGNQLLSSESDKKHPEPAASMLVPVWLDWEVHDGDSSLRVPGSACPRDAARAVCKSNHTQCKVGTRGGYTCSCQEGYDGNPYISNGCQDIDECDESNGYSCFGKCTNRDGRYDCICPPGTSGDPHIPNGCFTSSAGNCTLSCGNISVRYPFGIGPPSCYLSPGFQLACDTSHHPPRLMLRDLQVVEISLDKNTLDVIKTDGVLHLEGEIGAEIHSFRSMAGGEEAPYSLSTRNELILMGCYAQATLFGADNQTMLSGCSSSCPSVENVSYNRTTKTFGNEDDRYCYGVDCCQARISMSNDGMPSELWIYWMHSNNNASDERTQHSYAFIAKEGWFHKRQVSAKFLQPRRSTQKRDFSPTMGIPIVLDWEILQLQQSIGTPHPGNVTLPQKYVNCPGICSTKNSFCKPRIRGYSCHCNEGSIGNPYHVDGCTGGKKKFNGMSVLLGVSSGAVIVLLVLMAFFISKKLKHRRAQIMKQKFFKQNRGQLLQQLVSQKADIAERMIISLEELEKATNNFDKSRELGGGGHGTVYKGILSDLHVVAIKKPKKVIQREIDEFINEVAILSQINHKNVVKLYGCCLETEVPMLVYEFISNGTLHGHLHVERHKALPWDDRLRIATETAKTIAYLHSMASIPIIHRDIKSVNILLDDTLTAKIADFGASRYVPIDKSGITTMVQGTIGYMDPMYFYTGRLTEKSDVYGFGVMLVELLTRQKPFLYMSSEGDGLVAHFSALFAEGNLSQILDPQVSEEGGKEVEEVAELAVACIKLTGDDRPSMRQVELTLESVQSQKLSDNSVAARSQQLSTTMNCSWITDGRIIEDSTRQYSMEQAYENSAAYPR